MNLAKPIAALVAVVLAAALTAPAVAQTTTSSSSSTTTAPTTSTTTEAPSTTVAPTTTSSTDPIEHVSDSGHSRHRWCRYLHARARILRYPATGTTALRWHNCRHPYATWNWHHAHRFAVAYNRYWSAVLRFVAALQRARYLASLAPNAERWERVAGCESGHRWNANTGNHFYGGLQFVPSTYYANGGRVRPDLDSRANQIRVAENVRLHGQGLGAWPNCGRYW